MDSNICLAWWEISYSACSYRFCHTKTQAPCLHVKSPISMKDPSWLLVLWSVLITSLHCCCFAFASSTHSNKLSLINPSVQINILFYINVMNHELLLSFIIFLVDSQMSLCKYLVQKKQKAEKAFPDREKLSCSSKGF